MHNTLDSAMKAANVTGDGGTMNPPGGQIGRKAPSSRADSLVGT